MTGLLTDFRHGWRALLKRPGTSTLAALALGLGIGLTTTMFSIVNGAILRGLPFDEGNRILHLARLNPGVNGDDDLEVPLHDYVDWRERQRVFTDLAAFQSQGVIASGEGFDADRLRAARITANTLGLLRVTPALGRGVTDADMQPGAPAVALVSDRLWRTQLRGEPAAIGRVLRINGVPTEIVGVMPPRFAFPVSQDLWLPVQMNLPAVRGEGPTFEVIGRLNAGVSQDRATSEMRAIASQLEASHPENKGITVEVKKYVEEFIGGEVIATLFAMLGAVFGVLLIACANVTNLQLARAIERAREIAIRSAIGAARWRLVRQMLVEGLLLAAIGSLLGIAIAATGVTLFNRAIVDTNPPFWIDIRIDATVLLFVAAITAVAALLSTTLPALRVTRRGSSDILKDQGRGTTSRRTRLLSRVLVSGAVALSCALLLVSGLMIRSVVEIGRVTYAYSTDDVLLARTVLDEPTYPDEQAWRQAGDRLMERLRALPGLRTASLATSEPGGGGLFYLTKEGQTFERPEEQPTVRRISSTPEYFEALRMRATAGRVLQATDTATALPVTVITQDMADRYFPGENPVGQRVRLGRNPAWPWWTIVGVVPRLASAAESDAVGETAFVPFDQAPMGSLVLVLAASDDPLAIAPAARQAVRAIDQDLPVFGVESFAALIERRSWAFRVFGTLFMTFGVAALLMAAVGLYGVLAFGVKLRTQEIGVRIALGAGRRQVIGMIVRQGMKVVGIGLAIGLALGAAGGPLMAALFFNVTATDPLVFGLTATLLLGTGFVASLVPARRAASVDPLVALRDE